MDSTSLQQWQVEAIADAVDPGLRYLSKLRTHMDQTFVTDDKLFKIVQAAHNAMFALNAELDFLKCELNHGRSSSQASRRSTDSPAANEATLTEAEDESVRTLPARAAAEKTDRKVSTVYERRRTLGIPAGRRHRL